MNRYFYMKIGYGYNYQYTRNNLQLNGEMECLVKRLISVLLQQIGWAPLWMDFDNDGLKDLFISNGIPKRMNDMDYLNYISDDAIQDKLKNNYGDDQDLRLINKFPEIKLPNKFFKNKGMHKFEDISDDNRK